MAWTPQNLTNPDFVKTQLTPLDRSNALLTMNNNIDNVEKALARNQAALAAAQDLTNGPLSFGTVRDARRAATDAAAAGSPDAAALQKTYEELQAKRSIASADADRLLRNVQDGEEAIKTSRTAVNNLIDAGAVPPGTNQFTPPPGYTSTLNPPAEVPASQNPTNTSTTTENVQNPTALSVNPATDPNTNIGTEGQDLRYDPLQEPPNTNDGDEFSGIDEQVQRQKDLEDGSLEFAGIDEQIAANENALQEPPLLSDEEIDQQIRLAAQDDQIENKDPASVGEEDPFEAARIRAGEEFDRTSLRTEQDIIDAYGGIQGLQGSVNKTRAQQTIQDAENAKTQGDWRVRLSLAPGANYLYASDEPGILEPLQKTAGVIFPYTPNIQVTYAAHYDQQELIHSNYKIYQYKSSGVDQVVITCDFTAQDTFEANYLLAVIHFFRSVTKMFYGQDQNPSPGVPPPLCYLTGMGDFQFDRHPLLISSFNYNLPNDVDYIRASGPTLQAGVNSSGYTDNKNSDTTASQVRLNGLKTGARRAPPVWQTKPTNIQPTYVPTKIQLTITAYPVVSRNDISNNFSLEKYATGELLLGRLRPNGGGIW
jgi:hypothetical protein